VPDRPGWGTEPNEGALAAHPPKLYGGLDFRKKSWSGLGAEAHAAEEQEHRAGQRCAAIRSTRVRSLPAAIDCPEKSDAVTMHERDIVA
jgi:hypothetical protein